MTDELDGELHAAQLSLERPDPEQRAPVNTREHVRQLQDIGLRQAERIKWLTKVKRKLTLEEAEAILHFLEVPSHSIGSCPPGSGKLCPHREAAMEARFKMKQAVDK